MPRISPAPTLGRSTTSTRCSPCCRYRRPLPGAADLRRRAEAALEEARIRGIQVVTRDSPAYPGQLLKIPDPPPVLWVRGDAGPCRFEVAIVGSRFATPHGLEVGFTPGAGPGRRGIGRGERPGAGRRRRRPPRRAAGRRSDHRGAGMRRRCRLSARARAAGRPRSRRPGPFVSEFAPGVAAARMALPPAQPHHQRPVARRRDCRGRGAQRVAHHRAMRPGAGPVGDGGAGRRAERPEPGRARPPPGRRPHGREASRTSSRSSCTTGATSSADVAGVRPGTHPATGKPRPGGTLRDPVLRAMAAGEPYELEELAAKTGIDPMTAAGPADANSNWAAGCCASRAADS